MQMIRKVNNWFHHFDILGPVKEAEPRKLYLINHAIPRCHNLVDLGSGDGKYLPCLSQKANRVIAVDINKNLCKRLAEQDYEVVWANARYIPFKNEAFDCLWGSEIVEHLPSLNNLDELERVTSRKIVLTMPNPLSPHYKKDPSHILQYSVSSLRKSLRERSKRGDWDYVVRGLGYNKMMHWVIVKRATMYLTWHLPWLSPTIAIIAQRKGSTLEVS